MNMNIFIALLAFLLAPSFALAHTRWFAETELAPYITSEPTSIYLGVAGVIILIIISIGYLLERKGLLSLGFLAPHPKKPHVFKRASATFTMVAGAFFLIAGTHEYLFSPNLTLESGIPMTLITLQILVGLAFLLGIFSRIGGLLLILMWISLFKYGGTISALEDIWVLSTGLFITLMGNDYFAMFSVPDLRTMVAPFKNYALSFLRLGTGTTLMVLAFSEKIMAPELGINFLSIHPWNFMSVFGFSDYLFTISAGSVEFLLGLVFVLGIVTRLNALVTAIIFTIPLFILGPIELAGHLPHFAAVLMLLLFGNGGHLILFKGRSK